MHLRGAELFSNSRLTMPNCVCRHAQTTRTGMMLAANVAVSTRLVLKMLGSLEFRRAWKCLIFDDICIQWGTNYQWIGITNGILEVGLQYFEYIHRGIHIGSNHQTGVSTMKYRWIHWDILGHWVIDWVVDSAINHRMPTRIYSNHQYIYIYIYIIIIICIYKLE